MGGIKTWIDWAVLALCTIAALGAVLYGASVLDASAFTTGPHARSPIGALVLIAGLTLVNCGFLVGAALFKVRLDTRLGRR